ncbi:MULTISPECIES: poly-beta-1,6-N-acetyl-D-glucosamine biosynthesis protein PgaD [Acinetobacter]|nr:MULTISPECIES: poly-beta-1,6-N-acetyl-D-glucosamine biosynthesis protein PgaD [Acinetobacter]ENV55496.1 poly-beta-1,6-N-acetyl-D-glucosamine biosynthesis protein PgaD [Acinetobacter baylyi DSM 14961 = CIP 107474]KAF2370613.1 poly-beta-1,6-N-acetyl-D-glucosamine biosynthesis protein PgaD [Acinetobacter baylyi]KAF2373823.1 poly-beta-1,6-N-acetyl-D-glucosamine biosynthesis protein PgaD [Acinetobacter baylyi]KAF2377696.1 poly-beta-1,6-N-acetyl-D-glucosamine biosynthesis protein PgaD [Acinetobacte
MKSHDLIIDLRRQLPWHKRYVSMTTTAMMWGGWLLLWRPFLLVWLLVELQKTHLVHRVFSAMSLGLEHGITALIICSVSLLLWSNYIPAKSVKKIKQKDLNDYAGYFELNQQQIQLGRTQKVAIVHHDENGRITHIE